MLVNYENSFTSSAECAVHPHQKQLNKVVVAFKTKDILGTESSVHKLLGYFPAELHGSNFRIFCGPETDLESIGIAIENSSYFKTSLVCTSLYDRHQYPRQFRIRISPFYNDLKLAVACLIEFESLEQSNAGESSIQSSCGNLTHQRPDSGDQTVLKKGEGFLSRPGHDGAGPAIFPRRKGGGGVPATPVIITLEILKSMEGQPLHLAAQKLGISATAFKNACRKLGIQRWSYKKGGSNSAAIVLNNAYIQRVHRKYAHDKKTPGKPPVNHAAAGETGAESSSCTADDAIAPPAGASGSRATAAPLGADPSPCKPAGPTGGAAAAAPLHFTAPPLPESQPDVHRIFDMVLSGDGEEEGASDPAIFDWPRYT